MKRCLHRVEQEERRGRSGEVLELVHAARQAKDLAGRAEPRWPEISLTRTDWTILGGKQFLAQGILVLAPNVRF